MLLRDVLIAVWLAFKVAVITFLVEMFEGIDSAKEASEKIDSTTRIMLATMRIPPAISIPGPRRI